MKKLYLLISFLFCAIISKGQTDSSLFSIYSDTSKVLSQEHESISRTIFVSNDGKDTIGFGDNDHPFKTIEYAFQSIHPIFNINVNIIIQVESGTYTTDFNKITDITKDWILYDGATVTLQGSMFLINYGFTLTANSPESFIYDISQTWTENEYQDKFLYVSGSYYPILSNTTNSLKSFPGLSSATSIYEPEVIINATSNLFDFTPKYPALKNQRITIKNIKIIPSSGGINLYVSNIQFTFQECTFIANSFQINNGNASTDLVRINLIAANNGYNNDSPFTQLYYCMARKTGSKVGYGVRFGSYSYRAQRSVYVSGFLDGFEFVDGNYPFNQSLHNIIFDNCANAMTIRNGTNSNFSLEPIYIKDVNYLIATTEPPYFDYNIGITNIIGTPINDYLTSDLKSLGYVNILKNISIQIPNVSSGYSGNVTLINGSANVNTNKVSAGSLILLTPQNGYSIGNVWVSNRINGTSFIITSSDNLDNRNIGWLIINQ